LRQFDLLHTRGQKYRRPRTRTIKSRRCRRGLEDSGSGSSLRCFLKLLAMFLLEIFLARQKHVPKREHLQHAISMLHAKP
jgi:hypothetical protein